MTRVIAKIAVIVTVTIGGLLTHEKGDAATRVPHLHAWLCIHRYEGSWSDRGAPYWGGLQMDMTFMRTYGRRLLRLKGTANHWTPREQMIVANRAVPTRGFTPWPRSARLCGLL